MKIGFVGQGWIGRNYADNFEDRGFEVVRYSLENDFIHNKEKISSCDVVFIAVPTPTTQKGFDSSLVREVLKLVGVGKIAIIKSTVLPNTSAQLQKLYKKIIVLNSPEFLSEATARKDTDNPFFNIIGMAQNTKKHRDAANLVMSILPKAPYEKICSSTESEFIKYIHNINGYIQVVMFNILYDLSKKLKCDWNIIREIISADIYMNSKYSNPVHKKGRGAGGHCFIKDFSAFKALYKKFMPKDYSGLGLISAVERKNILLLLESKKDRDLLQGVYGDFLDQYSRN